MGIIRLEDKYKSKYKVQFTPKRHYISSSSGITGSVHVFPNRSETQKDNIDERLNLAPMAEEGNEFSGALAKAKEEGFKFYNFGIDVKHGEKPNKNLRYFKLGFGGLNVKRSSYSAKLKNLKI